MKRLTLSSVPLAALVTANCLSFMSPAMAAKVGINFQDGDGAPVTLDAFGVPAADWINLPFVPGSNGMSFTSESSITLPGAGPVAISWSAANTWSAGAAGGVGELEVAVGYLDDPGAGYRVTLDGLRNAVQDYKITLIASTDGGTGFDPVTLAHTTGPTTLTYPATVSFGGGIYAQSDESAVISAAASNNKITITSTAGPNRSTLAGIIIDYTPTATNPPVIEVQPVAPTVAIYQSQSVSLSVSASGSGLSYVWRKGGVPVAGNASALTPNFVIPAAVPGDSGSYDVVVSGVGTPATSTPVAVTIIPVQAPAFTTLPAAQSLYVGYPATFTAAASGGEIVYTWKKGATTVGTGPTFTLPSITAADAGTYSVTAANIINSATASTTLVVKTPTPGTYEAVQANQKPLLWYRYNETALPLVNTSTVANSGSLGGAVIGQAKRYIDFQQAGALTGDAANKAASFKTNSQFIDIPYTPDLNTTSFTAEMWIKPPAANNGRIDPLCNRGAAAGDGFLFFGWNGVTKWQFRTYNGTLRNQINSDVDIVPGAWAHLVGTYDSATNIQRFYVNGVEQGTPGGITATNGYTPNNTMPLRLIGFPNDNGDVGGGSFAGGALDEVAIYPAALSAAQVLAHYQNGTNASRTTAYASLVQADGPTAYLRLDDPVGPVPPVPVNSGTAGTAFNGFYGGDLLPTATGPTAPEDPGFESPNNAVGTTVNGYNVVQPLGITTNTLTVTTWLKRAVAFETTDDLSWPAWLGAGGGFHMDGTDGRPYGELRYHWDASQWAWGSGLQVPAEVWTFCALVLEPNRATVYMGDGNTLRKSTVAATHTPHLLNQAMGFGGNQAGRISRNYVGQLDESAFYNRALTETELLSLFVTGSGAPMVLDIAAGGVLNDSKSLGAPLNGLNAGSTWEASSTDTAAITRNGVQTFNQDPGHQIQVPLSPELNTPTGTIMFWVKATPPAGPGSDAAMLFDWRTTNGTVITLANAGNLFIQCSGGANTITDGYSLADDTWHHVAVTFNQDPAGAIAIYIDGTLNSDITNSAGWSWPTDGQPLIGKSRDAYWRRFTGQLDDFRFYSQILSAGEIAQIKNTGTEAVPSTLKLRYDFATAGSGLTLSWPFGILESSTTMQANDPWTPVPNAVSPLSISPTNPARFFRARLPQ